jgi:tetratricopeptide (TPR) repeat protein
MACSPRRSSWHGRAGNTASNGRQLQSEATFVCTGIPTGSTWSASPPTRSKRSRRSPSWETTAGLARAWILLSEVRISSGDAVEAARAARRGAELARRALSHREEAWALGAHAEGLLFGPLPVVERIRRLEGLLDEAAANPLAEPNLSAFVAALEAMRGDFGQARARMARSRQLTQDLGLRWQDSYHARLSGYVELLAGDPLAAERDIRKAKTVFSEIGDTWLLSIAACELSRTLYTQGRYEAAATHAEALEDSPAPADREWEIKRRGLRATLLAHEGRTEAAERLARDGVAIASDTDQLWFHADALIDLAEVLRMAGRPENAAGAAEEALRLYERKASSRRRRERGPPRRNSAPPRQGEPAVGRIDRCCGTTHASGRTTSLTSPTSPSGRDKGGSPRGLPDSSRRWTSAQFRCTDSESGSVR